jgi:tetratricopeptide (TPR) repeat protein
VIARNSVFTYKGKPVKVQQVSEELGVRYVLEGTLQKSVDRLRITAQLIDAKTGSHIWSEKYDREMDDIFALQDDMAMKVLKALQIRLTEGEQTQIYARGTDNLEAYLKLQKGREHIYLFNQKDNRIAKQMFEEAIVLDPNYPTPYEFLAIAYLMDVIFRWSKSPAESLEKANDLCQNLLSVDSSSAGAHRVLSLFHSTRREYDKAIAEAKMATELDPNDAGGYAFWGFALTLSGKYTQAIPLFEKAIVLNPLPPSWYLVSFGEDYFRTGRTDKAIEVFGRLANRDPKQWNAHSWLGFSFIQAGRPGEAVAEFDKALDLNPNLLWVSAGRILAQAFTHSPEKGISMLQNMANTKPAEWIYRYIAYLLRKEGQYEEGLKASKKALDLRKSSETHWNLGTFYVLVGQYDEAITELKASISLGPEYITPHLWLAAACSLSGRKLEARTAITEVYRINPSYSPEQFAKNCYFACKNDDQERILNALRQGGLE